MEPIEQAIFTSAETEQASGYQVIAASQGLTEAELCEIAAWGPSHGALLSEDAGAASLNFHPLRSGRFCASRTLYAGPEYSRRGGLRVYTQCLIVPPTVLARFANNPFALLRAALANGTLRVYDEIPRRLDPCTLSGRAAAVDTAPVARLCSSLGPEWLATLLQAALDSATMAVRGGPPAETLFAGILNCLPPSCRTQFSFSTGLKFSSRRPFRMVALGPDRQEQRRLERLYHVAVLDLDQPPPAEFAPVEAWSRAIHRILKSGRLSFLANQLARSPSELACDDLAALGLQLLEEFEATALGPVEPETASHPVPNQDRTAPDAAVATSRQPKPVPRLVGCRQPRHAERHSKPHVEIPPGPRLPAPQLPRQPPAQPSVPHSGAARGDGAELPSAAERPGEGQRPRAAEWPGESQRPRAAERPGESQRPRAAEWPGVADLPSPAEVPGVPELPGAPELPEDARQDFARLEGLVREAIEGRGEALGAFQRLWADCRTRLPAALADAARAALLNHVVALWRGAGDSPSSAQRAGPALEIVAILTAPGPQP